MRYKFLFRTPKHYFVLRDISLHYRTLFPLEGVSHGCDGEAKSFPEPCTIVCMTASQGHRPYAEILVRREVGEG